MEKSRDMVLYLEIIRLLSVAGKTISFTDKLLKYFPMEILMRVVIRMESRMDLGDLIGYKKIVIMRATGQMG